MPKKPAKKPLLKKKKRAPAALSGLQQDKVQETRDRKMTSIPQALKDGKIDTGDFATPEKGVLDPNDFEKFEVEHRPTMTEVQRIQKIICEHLDEYYSRGGKFQWVCGFFLEKDPRATGSGKYQALTVEMIGPAWSTQLQHELGLTEFNGALCWNGRGTFERHIICVKTKQLQERQLLANEEAMNEQLRQPDTSANMKTGRIEVTETTKRLPLKHPVGDGSDEEVAQNTD